MTKLLLRIIHRVTIKVKRERILDECLKDLTSALNIRLYGRDRTSRTPFKSRVRRDSAWVVKYTDNKDPLEYHKDRSALDKYGHLLYCWEKYQQLVIRDNEWDDGKTPLIIFEKSFDWWNRRNDKHVNQTKIL